MNTLQIGAVYVLFALGLTLIFGVMRIVNFAHGQFFTMAALMTSSLLPSLADMIGGSLWLQYLLSFLLSLATVVIVAALVYWIGFQRFLRDFLGSFSLSVGLLLLGQGVLLSIFGGASRVIPPLVEGNVLFLGGVMNLQRIVILCVAALTTVLLYGFVRYTKLGQALRAVADDREAAMLQGIRYRWICFIGFLIGSVLAAIAGGLMSSLTAVNPATGDDYLIKAFIIIIVGGLGSIPGSIIGGLLVAAVESIVGYLFDLTTAATAMFLLIIIFLLLRPQGLLGQAQRLN